MSPWFCMETNHRRCHNVWTSVTYLAVSCFVRFILMSFAICYWTDRWQHRMYLLTTQQSSIEGHIIVQGFPWFCITFLRNWSRRPLCNWSDSKQETNHNSAVCLVFKNIFMYALHYFLFIWLVFVVSLDLVLQKHLITPFTEKVSPVKHEKRNIGRETFRL